MLAFFSSSSENRRPNDFPIPGRWLKYRPNEPMLPYTDTDDGIDLAGYSSADLHELQQRNIIHPQWLSLGGSPKILDPDLKALLAFGDLRGLSLGGCENIGDAGIRAVSALENLEYLNLLLCHRVSDAGCAHLAGLSKLRWLDMSWVYHISNDGLSTLAYLPRLEELYLADNGNIDDTGIECLSRATHLRHLSIEMVDLTDVALQHLGDNARELRQLEFSRLLAVSDRGLSALPQYPNLIDLSFGGCPLITGGGGQDTSRIEEPS